MTEIEKGALERALTLCLLEDDEGFVPAPQFVPSAPHWRLKSFYEELLSLRGYEEWKARYWNPLIEIFGAVYITTAFAMDWTQYERVASSTALSRIRKEKQMAIRQLLSQVKSEPMVPPRGQALPRKGAEGSSLTALQEFESEILDRFARGSALDRLAFMEPPPETAEEGLERVRGRLEQHLATGRFRDNPEWRRQAMKLHKSCSKLLATCQTRLRPGVPLSETDRQRVRDLAEEFYAETFALDAIEGGLKLQATIDEKTPASDGKPDETLPGAKTADNPKRFAESFSDDPPLWWDVSRDGQILTGWNDILNAIKIPREKRASAPRQLRRYQKRLGGPIGYVDRVPRVDRGALKAWWEKLHLRGEQAQNRRESAKQLENPKTRKEAGLHLDQRPNAKGKALPAPDS